MNENKLNTAIAEKDLKNETAELNGIKIDSESFEIPRSTIEMLEQTFQIA